MDFLLFFKRKQEKQFIIMEDSFSTDASHL